MFPTNRVEVQGEQAEKPASDYVVERVRVGALA